MPRYIVLPDRVFADLEKEAKRRNKSPEETIIEIIQEGIKLEQHR